MLTAFTSRRPPRGFAALVVLCYFVVSTFLPFQHTHGRFLEESTPAKRIGALAIRGTTQTPNREVFTANRAVSSPDHCLACEWQAANVSPALPAYTLFLTPPTATQVVTTFPRYLRLPALPTSARAPPLA